MPQPALRAAARPMPKRRPPVSRSIRLRLEVTLENLLNLLDEIDGDSDLEDGHDREHDFAELSGIGDADGLVEQTAGEPSLGATLEIDQRIAWHAGQRSDVIDGEATGTEEDVEHYKSCEARQADRSAAGKAIDQLRQITRRRCVTACA
jgi:hypothetical protein